jgi:hypothetical protein
MALGEVPGREGGQRRRGEPEDPDRGGVGHSTAVRGGGELQIPRSVSSCARQNSRGQVPGAAAMARIQPQQLLRRGRGDQRRGVVRQRRSGDGDRDDLDALNKAVVAVDAVSFTLLQDQLQSVLATLSEREAGVVGCGSG